MRFIEFIKKLPKQDDKATNSFLSWAKAQTNFPSGSDPHAIAEELYKKLDHQKTLGFQKCLMIYFSMPNNELPKDLAGNQEKMLQAINYIIDLQESDKMKMEIEVMHVSGKFPEATRPLEYIGLFPASMPTKKDGEVFMYIAVDAFTRFAFNTGIERDNSPASILKHIKLLINHKDFRIQSGQTFTIVLHKYKEITPQINEIIQPSGGKVIFNDPYLTSIMAPVLENMMKFMSGKAE